MILRSTDRLQIRNSGIAVRAAPLIASAEATIKDDLLAWWTLDETSGNRADSHTGGLTLTDNNTVLYGTGKQGNAADFDPSLDEYLSSTSASLQLGNTDWTLGCWFKQEWLINQQLMSKDSVSNRNYTLDLESNKPRFYINGDKIVQHATATSAGVWYFVLAWHDSVGNTVNILVNDAGLVSGATAGVAPPTGSATFMLGRREYTGFTGPFNGLIDEAFIVNRILTPDERTWLYNSGNGRTYTDLP